MKIILLVILALIAYLLFKKFIAKPDQQHDANTHSLPDNTGSGTSGQLSNEVTATENTSAVSPSETSTQSSNSAISISEESAGGVSNTALFPNTGNDIADIQEFFKILNLRDSDAPRLNISRDQFTQLKGGSRGDLSDSDMNLILGKLKAML